MSEVLTNSSFGYIFIITNDMYQLVVSSYQVTIGGKNAKF